MSVGTGKLNIIILFWKYQFHCWKYINDNQTFILDSHRPFICSVPAGNTDKTHNIHYTGGDIPPQSIPPIKRMMN
jgi:hypothetical protein